MNAGAEPLLGAAFALSSALAWAVAALLWTRLSERVHPLGLSVAKSLLSLVPFVALVPFVGFGPVDGTSWSVLSLSGVLGIAVGDSLFFASLSRLGARRGLFVAALIPVVVAVASAILFDEAFDGVRLAGAALCVGGVAGILRERTPDDRSRDGVAVGVLAGVLSVLACSASVLLAKAGLATTGSLAASIVRACAGAVGAFGVAVAVGRAGAVRAAFALRTNLPTLLVATLVGSTLGVWLGNAALKGTSAGVATFLNSTSPLFVLVLGAGFGRERVSPRAAVAATATVAGIALLVVR